MRIVFFVSGGGNNLATALQLQKEYPALLQTGLVMADRLGIRAIGIAQEHNIPVIAEDFEAQCGVYKECRKTAEKLALYRQRAEDFHNTMLQSIQAFEAQHGAFDLAVLAYRRIITGPLLQYFEGRMVNQHPGDLAIPDAAKPGRRLLTGYDPVMKALQLGFTTTRTSTILVRNGVDNGEILARGPTVPFTGSAITREQATAQENRQKTESDIPVLRFVLKGIAEGNFGIAVNEHFADGCKKVLYKNSWLPYGGADLDVLT